MSMSRARAFRLWLFVLAVVVLETEVGRGGAVPLADGSVWSVTAPMTVARDEHTATLLASGKVLVVGGGVAELYDPATGRWTATSAMRERRRYGHAATLLPNGGVLVAGGAGDGGALSSAELYDPTGGKWTSAGSMRNKQAGHSLTLLSTGKVLVAGGPSAELYDPTTGKWTPTGRMKRAHGGIATLLADGRVLVTGSGFGLDLAEIYDPRTGSWSRTGPMAFDVSGHTATLLLNGMVLVTGGHVGGITDATSSAAQLFDPVKDTWVRTGSMKHLRFNHVAVLLASGRVLVAGGDRWVADLLFSQDQAEIYDPSTSAWTPTDSMHEARASFSATMLSDGRILAVGGHDVGRILLFPDKDRFRRLSSAELADLGDCASDEDCPSKHCVDGVCCNEACAGQCQACDVPGGVGICTSVDRAAPHGTRPPCSDLGRFCSAGACSRSCEWDSECASSAFCGVDRLCTPRLRNGEPCDWNTACQSGVCIDGVCCNTTCSGQCESCAAPGRLGQCMPIRGTPRGRRPACDTDSLNPCGVRMCDGVEPARCAGFVDESVACGDYCRAGVTTPAGRCDGRGECAAVPIPCGGYACVPWTNGCWRACTDDSACVATHACIGGACLPRKVPHCSPDRATAFDADDVATSCGAYRCGDDGRCASKCASTADCAADHGCTDRGECVKPARADDVKQARVDDGAGHGGGACGFVKRSAHEPRDTAVVMLAVAAILERRRRLRLPPAPLPAGLSSAPGIHDDS